MTLVSGDMTLGDLTVNCYVGLCRVIYGYVRLCRAMYGYLRPCTAMHAFKRLCTAMQGYVSYARINSL